MPYAPGIQDISGQLLAQGMLGAAQTRAQAMGDVGQFMRSFGSEILKNEEERQKTTGAIKAFIDDPYYQQKIAQNPELTSAVDRIKAGKAGSAEVKGFLGTLTTMQHTREEQMKADQMQAQTQYNQALREQAIATSAATQAATSERLRLRDEALRRAKVMAEEFGKADTSPEVEDFIYNVTGEMPAESRPRSSMDVMRSVVGRGVPMDEGTIEMFRRMGEAETAGSKIYQQGEIARQKAETAATLADIRRTAAEERLKIGEQKLEQQAEDAGIRAIRRAKDAGEITAEEYAELLKQRLRSIAMPKNDLGSLLEGLVNFNRGDSSGGATTGTKPATTTRTPASARYNVVTIGD